MPESELEVLVQRLDPDLPLPAYAHPGDAGADLVTAVDVELAPGERALVPTGIALALPAGYAGFVHPRSGLAARHGVTVVNAPGTIDAGYRGEVRVNLLNTDPDHPVRLARGDRIAQLVVQRVERAAFRAVDALPGSARGAGGHGSTGGLAPQDAGDAVQGAGDAVQGAGGAVQGAGGAVQGAVQGAGGAVQDAGGAVQDSGDAVQDAREAMQGVG